jgi:hypothetical protein
LLLKLRGIGVYSIKKFRFSRFFPKSFGKKFDFLGKNSIFWEKQIFLGKKIRFFVKKSNFLRNTELLHKPSGDWGLLDRKISLFPILWIKIVFFGKNLIFRKKIRKKSDLSQKKSNFLPQNRKKRNFCPPMLMQQPDLFFSL